MPEQFHEPIINFLSSQDGTTLRVADLAERMNIAPDERQAFEQAVDELARGGRVVWGAGRMISLPALGNRVIGTFRQTSRGFGFVIPDEPNAHGDLFIPAGDNLDAVTGDFVVAKVVVREKDDTRDRRRSISGRIIEILKRATNRAVGTLQREHNRWLVIPDGNIFKAPIEVQDVTAKSAHEGDKLVVELLTFPGADQPATGVIVEVLGPRGEPEVELQSVIRQFELPQAFPEAVLQQARTTASTYDPADFPGREDLRDQLVITIDPDDARDFDDAISLRLLNPRTARAVQADDVESLLKSAAPSAAVWELGVHIADVSSFVPVNTPLDLEARIRGNSTYFPRFVIPMLPEILSNGICSLQEGQPRLTKTAFIRYDAQGNVVSTRFANTLIQSRKRLTYRQAQAVIDDARGEAQPYTKGLLEAPPNPNVPAVAPDVRALLVNMDRLARAIRQRRLAAGMIVLDLPEAELVMDEQGHVIDARPEDDSFTHKIIEMFMVEANEAVSTFLTRHRLPVLRRVHPDPDIITAEQVRQFVLLAGRKVPKVLDRRAIQQLIDSVRGTPIAYAVHLAILKTFTTAEYSPLELGHYALASENYAHFTSPIRRYADLVIHRALNAVLTHTGQPRKTHHVRTPAPAPALPGGPPAGPAPLMPPILTDTPDFSTLVQLGKHLSFTERRSSDAERELRAVKILQLMAEHIGDVIDGVVTGVTGFGVFVQSTRFLTEGMIRTADLPDDFWAFDDRTGSLRGQRSGRRIALGDRAKVQIVAVHVPARQLEFRMLEHGSAIGGDTTLRRVEPRKPPKPRAEQPEDAERQPQRRKNVEKRLARKQARGQAARPPAGRKDRGRRGRRKR